MSPLSNWLARQRDLLNQESHGVNNKNRLPGPPDKTATGVNNTAEMPPLHSGPPGLPHPGAAFKVKTKGLAFKPAVLCGTCDSKTGLKRGQDGHIIIIEKLKDSPLPKRLDPKGYLVSQPHQSASYKVLRCDKNFDERQIIDPTSEDPLRLENGDPPSQPHIGDFHKHVYNNGGIKFDVIFGNNFWGNVWNVVFRWGANQPKRVDQDQPEEPLETANNKYVEITSRPKNGVQSAGKSRPVLDKKETSVQEPRAMLDRQKTLKDLQAKIEFLRAQRSQFQKKRECLNSQLQTLQKNKQEICRLQKSTGQTNNVDLIKALKNENKKILTSVRGMSFSQIDKSIKKKTEEIDSELKMKRRIGIARFEKPPKQSPPGHVAAAAA